MRLHASSIQDTNLGLHEIHSQLASLHLELQSLKKGKETKIEVCAEVWCFKCKGHGHDKDHYLVYVNYITRGGGNSPKARSPSRAEPGGCTMVCYLSSCWATSDR